MNVIQDTEQKHVKQLGYTIKDILSFGDDVIIHSDLHVRQLMLCIPYAWIESIFFSLNY